MIGMKSTGRLHYVYKLHKTGSKKKGYAKGKQKDFQKCIEQDKLLIQQLLSMSSREKNAS